MTSPLDHSPHSDNIQPSAQRMPEAWNASSDSPSSAQAGKVYSSEYAESREQSPSTDAHRVSSEEQQKSQEREHNEQEVHKEIEHTEDIPLELTATQERAPETACLQDRATELGDNDQTEPFAHAKYGLAAVVGIYLMYQFAGGALHSLSRRYSSELEIVLQGLGQLLFMLMPAVLIMRYSPLKIQGLMRFGGEVTIGQWICGLMGIVGIQVFDAGFIAVQERLVPSFLMPLYQQLRVWSDMVEQYYRTSFSGTTPLEAVRALIVGAVVPAFAEEILFRGVLQRSLEEVYPLRRAVLVTSVLFGIVHFNPLSLIPLILIGAYLGFLAYYTQSLALPIVAHFVSNAIAIVALYAPSQGLSASPYGMPIERAALLLGIGLLTVIGAYMVIRYMTPRTPPVRT
ncbi:MAG: type II CAAX endopeptidase family protein [Bacteroidota bacterium]|nr:CPBP family intramembrane metalloprotease [Candidatus Kapabacteria bacterium]MDW8220334.1 type II CAAX endopeptidase family protein [Bacteroidota bacterium]